MEGLIILAGNSDVNETIFKYWSTVKTAYQYTLAVQGKRDSIPWAKLEADHYPQSRITDLFKACWNTNTFPILESTIRDNIPRIGVIMRAQGNYSFFR
jgi:hypothetical protein